MRGVIALIGFASAAVLIFVGIKVVSGTGVEVWSQLTAIPYEFFRYVSNAFSRDMLWTVLVLVGIVAAIAIVRGVPPAKAR